MSIEGITRERIAFGVAGYKLERWGGNTSEPCVCIYIDDKSDYADIELTIDEARVAIALIEQAIEEATQEDGENK